VDPTSFTAGFWKPMKDKLARGGKQDLPGQPPIGSDEKP